jgi:hypothetical protein
MIALRKNAGYFTKVLGEPITEEQSLTFPVKGEVFKSFRIISAVENKFMGRVCKMLIEASIETPKNDCFDSAELCYSGFFLKGKPFFSLSKKSKNASSDEAVNRLLNSNRKILEECAKLDLELLKVFYDEPQKIWKIQVQPYGGSLVSLMLPPMHYNVELSMDHAARIFSVMCEIAMLIHKEA